MTSGPAGTAARTPRRQTSSEELVDILQEVSRRLVGITASALMSVDVPGAAEVTLSQYRMLVVLTMGGSSTPSALAGELDVSRPAITRVLAILQARGLVSRRGDPNDGRQSWIAISPSGSAIVKSATAQRAKSLRAVVSRLSVSEATALKDSMHRMLDVLRPRTRSGTATSVASGVTG